MNQFTLEGTLTRDVKLVYSLRGHPLMRFGLESPLVLYDPGAAEKDEPAVFDVVWYAAVEELGRAENWMRAGKRIRVTGELSQELWTDKTTRETRRRTVLVARAVELAKEEAHAGVG
jgi:single-stranded DNA-binding protein